MANLREIKRRIDSVKSTMQVTRTMEMISTAKIRRALDNAQAAEPFKDAITRMLANVAGAVHGAWDISPLLVPHTEEKNVVFVLIASDRGMAGGFNIVPEREVQKQMSLLAERGISSELITCGKKPTEYFTYRGVKPVLSFVGSSSEPTMEQADAIATYVQNGYAEGKIDRVVLYYSHARNRVDQVQVVEHLLPISYKDLVMPNRPRTEDPLTPVGRETYTEYTFEPSAREVLGYLIPAYLRTVVYHALLDSAAAEHGARRRAMQSATDNAKEVIATLSRTYNRGRQDSITTELNEIIGGASALEDE